MMKLAERQFISESGAVYRFVPVYDGETLVRTDVYRGDKKLISPIYVSEENTRGLIKEYKKKKQSSKGIPVKLSDLEEWLGDWREPLKGIGHVFRLDVTDGRVYLRPSTKIDTSNDYAGGNNKPAVAATKPKKILKAKPEPEPQTPQEIVQQKPADGEPDFLSIPDDAVEDDSVEDDSVDTSKFGIDPNAAAHLHRPGK